MRLAVLGAGGHAREVLDVLEASAPDVVTDAVLFEEPGTGTSDSHALVGVRGYEVVDRLPRDATHYLPAVGGGALRRRLAQYAEAIGLLPYSAVSPLSSVPDRTLRPAIGLVCFAGSYISTNVTLGKHCHLNQGCRLSHDVRIGDYVTLGPGCLLTGASSVGDGASLGAGVVVLPQVQVGKDAVVGAGAVVVEDVTAGSVVVGNPARPLHGSKR